MGDRSHNRDGCSKTRQRHAQLMVSKRGVYLIRGDSKLKNIQLISWEQLLGAAPGDHGVAPREI
jgi:hypothetical protein